MRRITLGAAFATAAALSAQAASITDGKYNGTGDGSELSLEIDGETATIRTTVYRQCSGGGTGQIKQVTDGRWRITLAEHGACLIDVRRTSNGYELSPIEGGSCEAYSGFACGLGGTVSAQ